MAEDAASRNYFSIAEVAERWRVSRGTVYNRLRATGARVLDFAPTGKKGKKAVSARVVLEMEARQTKRLR
jgi:transposase